MPNEVLTVSAHCPDNPACIFTGSDMRIEVVIRNTGTQAIGYPLLSGLIRLGCRAAISLSKRI